MFVWRVLPGRAEARPGAFLTVPSLARRGIRVALTTRAGGVSDPKAGSLNLSFLAGDDPECVRMNRARVLEALGAPPDAWTNAQQVHGTKVAHAGPSERGRGAFDANDTIPGVDALWTSEPGTALAVLVADCLPLLLADARNRRIAVVHAGWRGLVGGIVTRAVQALAEAGTDPRDVEAFAGPSIGPCHYEVGGEVAEPAREALGEKSVSSRGGSLFLDLWSGVRTALSAAGVRAVWPSGLCTSCEPHRFFSHRAGAQGRQALVAVLS